MIIYTSRYHSLIKLHQPQTMPQLTAIESFVKRYIILGDGLVSNTSSIIDAYVKFNGGDSTGKLKLYAHIQSLDGVSKVKTKFYGLSLVVQPDTKMDTKTDNIRPGVSTQTEYYKPEDDYMSSYEKMHLEIKKEKNQLKKELNYLYRKYIDLKLIIANKKIRSDEKLTYLKLSMDSGIYLRYFNLLRNSILAYLKHNSAYSSLKIRLIIVFISCFAKRSIIEKIG